MSEKRRIRITIPEKLYQETETFAEDQDRTVNNLIAHALNTYLRRYKKQGKK